MPVVRQCYHAYVYKILIRIYHVVQELWTFSLTGNGRTDRQTDALTVGYTVIENVAKKA